MISHIFFINFKEVRDNIKQSISTSNKQIERDIFNELKSEFYNSRNENAFNNRIDYPTISIMNCGYFNKNYILFGKNQAVKYNHSSKEIEICKNYLRSNT